MKMCVCVPPNFKALYLKTNLLHYWGLFLYHLLFNLDHSGAIRKEIKIPKTYVTISIEFIFFYLQRNIQMRKFFSFLDKKTKIENYRKFS